MLRIRAGLVVRINNWEHWIENKRPIRSPKTGFFVTLTRNCHLSQTATDKIFMRSPYKMFHQTRHDVIFNSKCPSKVYMYLSLPSIVLSQFKLLSVDYHVIIFPKTILDTLFQNLWSMTKIFHHLLVQLKRFWTFDSIFLFSDPSILLSSKKCLASTF